MDHLLGEGNTSVQGVASAIGMLERSTDRGSTIPPNAVDLDTVLGLLKEKQDLQFERESKRQKEDRRAFFKLEANYSTDVKNNTNWNYRIESEHLSVNT